MNVSLSFTLFRDDFYDYSFFSIKHLLCFRIVYMLNTRKLNSAKKIPEMYQVIITAREKKNGCNVVC